MEHEPLVLAVETSGLLCSVAALINEKEFSEVNINQKYIHSDKLIEIIDTTLNSVDLKLNDMKHIAISVGPGSFTGLRVGLSAVKGIALGASLPVVISSSNLIWAQAARCLELQMI